jgi:hypothetical protein
MSKQTAVEWLYFNLFSKQLNGFSEEEWDKIDLALEQALAMEKEQIEDAWDLGRRDINYPADGIQYYNQTYKENDK